MQFSEAWLRAFVDPPIDTAALCDKLTMAGFEVENVAPAAPPFANVVVGEIVSVAPHPDADRLRVCSVNVGHRDLLQIVWRAERRGRHARSMRPRRRGAARRPADPSRDDARRRIAGDAVLGA